MELLLMLHGTYQASTKANALISTTVIYSTRINSFTVRILWFFLLHINDFYKITFLHYTGSIFAAPEVVSRDASRKSHGEEGKECPFHQQSTFKLIPLTHLFASLLGNQSFAVNASMLLVNGKYFKTHQKDLAD